VDGLAYIAMRQVEGRTLADQPSSGPLLLDEALRIVIEAAEALSHAHARGVLHRDVKSSNIMLTPEGHVVVVDFGLAVAEGQTRHTLTGAALGTAAYMAPEVIQGHEATAASDLYGLGVVLYELITGVLPFRGERRESQLYAAVHTPPEPPSRHRADVPPVLDRLVLRALEKDPALRERDAASFARACRALASGQSTPDAETTEIERLPPAVVPEPPRKPRRARPRRWILLGVGAIAVALGIWRRDTVLHWFHAEEFSSVAVLPLQNLSAAPEEIAFLANGLSETLATQLTRLSGLRVTPWVTSQRYGVDERPIAQIAAELGVQAVLVGTVKEVDGRLLVTVSLVDAKSNFQRWSQEFERPRADLLGVQRDIAIDVATQLRGRSSSKEVEDVARPLAKSSEAYEHYLRAVSLLGEDKRESFELAEGLFERALKLDPELVEAHVGVGAMRLVQYTNSWAGGFQNLEAAEASFRRALALDPRSSDARRGLIRVYFSRGEEEKCLQIGKEVAALGMTDATALTARADAYQFGTLWLEAAALYDEVVRLDPANVGARAMRVVCAFYAGRLDEVVTLGQRFIEMFGEEGDGEVTADLARARACLGDLEEARRIYESVGGPGDELSIVLERLGSHAEAQEMLVKFVAEIEQKLSLQPDNYWLAGPLANAYARLNRIEELRVLQERLLREQPKNGHVPAGLGLSHAIAGDADEAVRLWRAALALRSRYHIAQNSCRLTCVDPTLLPRFEGVMREYEALGEKWSREY
jgi:TolB-like protein/thioredoxin-like negative regulator of GroEL